VVGGDLLEDIEDASGASFLVGDPPDTQFGGDR
jgi:hypothetical protein